jgi:hypothetical protein
MTNLLKANPAFEHNGVFLKITKNRLVYELKKSKQPFQVVGIIQSYLNKLTLFQSYKRTVFAAVKAELLDQVHLEKITLEDMEYFGGIFIRSIEEKSFLLKGLEKEKYEILEALYTFFYGSIEQINAFYRMLDHHLVAKVNDLGKSLLKEKGEFKPYERFVLLFKGGLEGMEHKEIFSYIAIYGSEKEMIDYINWSFKKYGTNGRYKHSLKNYLIADRNSIWKNKNRQKELKKIRSQSFHKLLKEVKYQSSSPAIRFFRKYGLFLALFTVVLIGGFIFLQELLEEDKPVALNKEKMMGTYELRLEREAFQRFNEE